MGLHQFRNALDGDWDAWMPCPETLYGQLSWCRNQSGHFSTLLIGANLPPRGNDNINLYLEHNGGFVIAPHLPKLLCAYRCDGGTMQLASANNGCGYKACSSANRYKCSWRPE